MNLNPRNTKWKLLWCLWKSKVFEIVRIIQSFRWLSLIMPYTWLPSYTVKFKRRQVKWFPQDHILSVRNGLILYVTKNIFIKNKSSNNCQFTWFCRLFKSYSAWTSLWILFMSQAALGWLCLEINCFMQCKCSAYNFTVLQKIRGMPPGICWINRQPDWAELRRVINAASSQSSFKYLLWFPIFMKFVSHVPIPFPLPSSHSPLPLSSPPWWEMQNATM